MSLGWPHLCVQFEIRVVSNGPLTRDCIGSTAYVQGGVRSVGDQCL
jgi:hypothetical protein